MELSDIFGGSIGGLLAPEDQQKLTNNALLNAGLGILAASSGGARRYAGMPDRPALGQALLQGLQAGTGAYQTGAQNLLSGREYQEKMAQKKRQQELNAQLSPLLQGGDKYNAYMMAGNKAAEMGDIDTANRYFELATKFQTKPAESPFAKIDPKDYTPESIQAYVQGGNNPTLLVAKEKPVEAPSLNNDRDATAFELYAKPFNKLTPQEAKQVNQTLRNYDLQNRKAGATNVSVGMPTEGERNAGFLTNRIQGALEQINAVVSKNPKASVPNAGARAVELLTGSETLKNLANPATRQQIETAQLDLLDAALTLGTGAAYTTQQLEGYRNSYFPQIGDKPPVIKDKQERLNRLLSSARIKAGRANPADVGLPQGVTVKRIN